MSKELATELQPILTELEMVAEKNEVMLWDLNEHYFAEPEPDKALLAYYYKQMGIRSSIARKLFIGTIQQNRRIERNVKT